MLFRLSLLILKYFMKLKSCIDFAVHCDQSLKRYFYQQIFFFLKVKLVGITDS